MTAPDETSPADLDDLRASVTELQAEQQAQVDDKAVKALTDVATKMFDRSAAYNNIVLVAGYAGGFTVWSFTRAQLPGKANVAIALALIISLASFVLFEVIKMIAVGIQVMRYAGALKSASDAAEKLKAIKAIDDAHSAVLVGFRWYWVFTLLVAVGGALIALALLAYNFMANLLRWPGWPT